MLFLLAIAIVDDIIAIAIIAVFYGDELALEWLGAAVALVVLICAWRPARVAPYVVFAIALWIAVYQSGVHATIAGVVVGLLLPVPLGERVEHSLHPYSAFVIVPLFAFANAGVDFGGGVLGDAL